MSQAAEGGSQEVLCESAVKEAVSAARESVEQYLRNTFDEIDRLQTAPEFLKNVEAVQEKSQALETWKVQREQLAAVEQCAQSCTCDKGSRLVIQEYNTLAGQADKTAGLVTVPLPGERPGWEIALIIGLVVAAAYFISRRKTV